MNTLFLEAIKNDYYTPRIKAEVIFDMLLTPLIEEIIAVNVGDESNDIKLITKEFPVLKSIYKKLDGEEYKEDCQSKSVDFVLVDDLKIYLVELKTDNNKFKTDQFQEYMKLIKKYSKDKMTSNNVGHKPVELLYDGLITNLESFGPDVTKVIDKYERLNSNIEFSKKLIKNSATDILINIYEDRYGNDNELIIAINAFGSNDRKYFWQIYKMMKTTGKRTIKEIFFKNESNDWKELEVKYIIPSEKCIPTELDKEENFYIYLNNIVAQALEFNGKKNGYLSRDKESFIKAWSDFCTTWRSLNLDKN